MPARTIQPGLAAGRLQRPVPGLGQHRAQQLAVGGWSSTTRIVAMFSLWRAPGRGELIGGSVLDVTDPNQDNRNLTWARDAIPYVDIERRCFGQCRITDGDFCSTSSWRKGCKASFPTRGWIKFFSECGTRVNSGQPGERSNIFLYLCFPSKEIIDVSRQVVGL